MQNGAINHISAADTELYLKYTAFASKQDQLDIAERDYSQIMGIAEHLSDCEICRKRVQELANWQNDLISEYRQFTLVEQQLRILSLAEILSRVKIVFKKGGIFLKNKSDILLDLGRSNLVPQMALSGTRGAGNSASTDLMPATLQHGQIVFDLSYIFKPGDAECLIVQIVASDGRTYNSTIQINGTQYKVVFNDSTLKEGLEYRLKVTRR